MDDKAFSELYPFESNFIDLEDNGLRYHYLDEGPKDAPVLLMLHGNPTWSFYYRDLVKGLRDRYRCIVPDHIGCGFSDKPQDYDEYRLAKHIDHVRQLLTHLKIDSYSLICHDWGGPIGFGTAQQKPDELERMVIFNTTGVITDHYPWRILVCRLPIIGPLAIRGLNLFSKVAIWHGSYNKKRMTKDVQAGLLKPYDNWHNRIGNHAFVMDIMLDESHPSWKPAKDLEAGLPALNDRPVMICWGKKDFCFDDFFLNAFKKDFPDAEYHEFANAGHYVVEDEQDAIFPLVDDFLKRTAKA